GRIDLLPALLCVNSVVSVFSVRGSPSAPERLAPSPLHRDPLRREHLALEREHARRRLVDLAREGDRALEGGLEAVAILEASRRILVLDDEVRVRDVEVEQLARG